jgi:hypothetical protein
LKLARARVRQRQEERDQEAAGSALPDR